MPILRKSERLLFDSGVAQSTLEGENCRLRSEKLGLGFGLMRFAGQFGPETAMSLSPTAEGSVPGLQRGCPQHRLLGCEH